MCGELQPQVSVVVLYLCRPICDNARLTVLYAAKRIIISVFQCEHVNNAHCACVGVCCSCSRGAPFAHRARRRTGQLAKWARLSVPKPRSRKQSRAHCLSQLNQLNLTSAKSCVWGDCMKITAGERLGWPTDLLDPVSG